MNSSRADINTIISILEVQKSGSIVLSKEVLVDLVLIYIKHKELIKILKDYENGKRVEWKEFLSDSDNKDEEVSGPTKLVRFLSIEKESDQR